MIELSCVPEAARACLKGFAPLAEAHRPDLLAGGARRASAGKGAYTEIPPLGVACVARRLEEGIAKYGRRGASESYMRGWPLSAFLDKALRHAFLALAGETDEDHVAAAAADLLSLAEIRERIRRGDLPAERDDLGLAGDCGATVSKQANASEGIS